MSDKILTPEEAGVALRAGWKKCKSRRLVARNRARVAPDFYFKSYAAPGYRYYPFEDAVRREDEENNAVRVDPF